MRQSSFIKAHIPVRTTAGASVTGLSLAYGEEPPVPLRVNSMKAVNDVNLEVTEKVNPANAMNWV
jgi:hypothetical protein